MLSQLSVAFVVRELNSRYGQSRNLNITRHGGSFRYLRTPIFHLRHSEQVVNSRSALLSNYEVLTLLRELESDHLAKARTALRIKKEEEATGSTTKHHVVQEEVCENLRTMEVEVITKPR